MSRNQGCQVCANLKGRFLNLSNVSLRVSKNISVSLRVSKNISISLRVGKNRQLSLSLIISYDLYFVKVYVYYIASYNDIFEIKDMMKLCCLEHIDYCLTESDNMLMSKSL